MNDHWKRLRERVAASTTRKDGIYTVVGCPPCACPTCVDDLSILTDFDEAIARAERSESQLRIVETERGEALDALGKLQAAQKHVLEVMCAGEDAYMAAFDGAEAVLAKAGRR